MFIAAVHTIIKIYITYMSQNRGRGEQKTIQAPGVLLRGMEPSLTGATALPALPGTSGHDG